MPDMEFEYLKPERSKPPKRWTETAFWVLLAILFFICMTLLALVLSDYAPNLLPFLR